MIKGVIVGHSDLGEAVLSAVESISGQLENINFVSNKGLSTSELSDEIKALCFNSNNDGALIFVDVYGGSCWRAAKMAKATNAHIVTGLNIPMILSFIHKRTTVLFDELPSVLERDGKRAIMSE